MSHHEVLEGWDECDNKGSKCGVEWNSHKFVEPFKGLQCSIPHSVGTQSPPTQSGRGDTQVRQARVVITSLVIFRLLMLFGSNINERGYYSQAEQSDGFIWEMITWRWKCWFGDEFRRSRVGGRNLSFEGVEEYIGCDALLSNDRSKR